LPRVFFLLSFHLFHLLLLQLDVILGLLDCLLDGLRGGLHDDTIFHLCECAGVTVAPKKAGLQKKEALNKVPSFHHTVASF